MLAQSLQPDGLNCRETPGQPRGVAGLGDPGGGGSIAPAPTCILLIHSANPLATVKAFT